MFFRDLLEILRMRRDPRLLLKYLETGSLAKTKAYNVFLHEKTVQKNFAYALRMVAATDIKTESQAAGIAVKIAKSAGIREHPILWHLLCRLTQPSVVVETGVADGFSSAMILYALNLNGAGRLYSIDLPNDFSERLPPNTDQTYLNTLLKREPLLETGWVVEPRLRDRWNLIVGRSDKKLPELLKRTGPIDFFLHDSEHSYENMMFEFTLAWRYLKAGGILASDDIDLNQAFFDFLNERRGEIERHYISKTDSEGFIIKKIS